MDLEVGEIVPLPFQDLHFLRFYILGTSKICTLFKENDTREPTYIHVYIHVLAAI